jgi:transposase
MTIRLHHKQISVLDDTLGVYGSQVSRRCLILKGLHEGLSQEKVAAIVGVDQKTVYNTKKKFQEHGLETAIHEAPRSGRPIEIDERLVCEIAACVCSEPPAECARWTLDLVVENLSAKGFPAISRESVRLVLRNHNLKPWQQESWCIPNIDATFVERMNDVLDLYERPVDPARPLVCIDEKPVHLIGDTRPSIPMELGKPERVDHEYERNGQASIFVAIEPHTGKFTTQTSETRDGIDFAIFMGDLASKYKDAEKIVAVMDNLSTHTVNSLIKAYGDELGQRIWDRFEIHYTPVHASWLNQAEIAIGMLQTRCLGKRRIANINVLKGKVQLWTSRVNEKPVRIKWKFTKEKAAKVFKLGS